MKSVKADAIEWAKVSKPRPSRKCETCCWSRSDPKGGGLWLATVIGERVAGRSSATVQAIFEYLVEHYRYPYSYAGLRNHVLREERAPRGGK